MYTPVPEQIARAADVAAQVAEWRARQDDLIDCPVGKMTVRQCRAYQGKHFHKEIHQGDEYPNPKFAQCQGCIRYKFRSNPKRGEVSAKLWSRRMAVDSPKDRDICQKQV